MRTNFLFRYEYIYIYIYMNVFMYICIYFYITYEDISLGQRLFTSLRLIKDGI